MAKKIDNGIKRGDQQRPSDGARDVKIPTSGRGNSKGDQKWLEEQTKAGLIEEIDADEANIPFGALRRWKGDAKTLGSYFNLPPKAYRCRGRSRVRDADGRVVVDSNNEVILRPCAHAAIRGGKVCVAHGGGTKRVQQAAKLRLLGAADAVIGELIEIAMNDALDPKARVQAINSILDRSGINQKVELDVESPGFEKVLKGMFGVWGEDGGDDDGGDEAAS